MKEVLEKFLGIEQKQVPSFIGFGSNAVHRLTRFLYLEGMAEKLEGFTVGGTKSGIAIPLILLARANVQRVRLLRQF